MSSAFDFRQTVEGGLGFPQTIKTWVSTGGLVWLVIKIVIGQKERVLLQWSLTMDVILIVLITKGTLCLRAYSFGPSLFSSRSSVFGRLQNLVLLVLFSKNGRFRRPSKPSASWTGRLRRLWKDSRSDVFSLWQLGLRASVLSWSLRNLPKSISPFFRGWKTSPAKSTGFRIQLLSTENRRYQKNTPLQRDIVLRLVYTHLKLSFPPQKVLRMAEQLLVVCIWRHQNHTKVN